MACTGGHIEFLAGGCGDNGVDHAGVVFDDVDGGGEVVFEDGWGNHGCNGVVRGIGVVDFVKDPQVSDGFEDHGGVGCWRGEIYGRGGCRKNGRDCKARSGGGCLLGVWGTRALVPGRTLDVEGSVKVAVMDIRSGRCVRGGVAFLMLPRGRGGGCQVGGGVLHWGVGWST